MDPMAEKRYQALKRKLDALHYSQPMTIESAALVERLLNDLIKTTEGFQSLKKQNEEIKAQLVKEKQLLIPLKKENERVVRENNEMHMEVIRVKEEVEAKQNKWRAAIKALENERSDLQFVINQKDYRISGLDTEVLRLKEKLDSAFARNYLPSQNEVLSLKREEKKMLGQTEANILGRKQDIAMTHTLPPKKFFEEMKDLPRPGEDEQVWADELRVADERCKKFREQAEKIEKNLSEALDANRVLNKQIEARDIEIKRLQGLYEGGQNIEKLATKYLCETNDQTIIRLNSHIDFLNKENHRLESELKNCKPEERIAAASLKASQRLRESQTMKKQEQMLFSIRELEKSVGLLNSEKSSLMLKLEEVEREYQNKLQAEEQKADILKEQMNIMEKELGEKELIVESSSKLKAAYTSDKRAYSEVIENVKSSQSNLEKSNVELRSDLEKARQELEKARNEINIFKGKYTGAAREIEMAKNSSIRVVKEAQEQSEEIISLRKQVHNLEGELLGVKGEKTNLKFEVERLTKQKYRLEEQISAFKNETQNKKSEVEGIGATASRLELLYNNAKSEIDFLKKDNQQLEQLLAQQKAKVSELDQQNRNYYLELTSAQENIKTLKQEHKNLSDELSEKISELRKVDSARVSLERKLEEKKSISTQINSMTTQAQKYMQENAKLQNERALQENKIEGLTKELEDLNNMCEDYSNKFVECDKENRELREKNIQLEEENIILNTQFNKAKTSEQDLQVHKSTLEKIQKKDIGISRELAEAKSKSSRLELELARCTRRLGSVEERNKELEKINKERLEENMKLKIQITTNSKNIGIEGEYLKSIQSQADDAHKALIKETQQRERLEKEMQNIKKELENSHSKEAILNDQITKLKRLVENLDKTKDELLTHIKQVSEGKKLDCDEKKFYESQIETLKINLNNKNNEIAALNQNLVQMDANLDQMQKDLDDKTEENEKLRISLEQFQTNTEMMKSQLGSHSLKEDTYSKRVYERENEIRQLRTKIENLTKELKETTEALRYKTKEAEDYANDIEALAKENESISAELVRISQLKEHIEQAHEDTQTREKGAHQTIRAAELEREDILHSYNTVCEENIRIKENISEIINENKDMIMKMQEYEQELYNRELQLQSADQNERKYLAEIQTLEKQISNLVKELENAQKMVRDFEGKKLEMIQDIETAKKVSINIESSKDGMQRAMASLNEDKEELQNRLEEAEQLSEFLKAQVDTEKVKSSQLELILSQERNTQHEQQVKIQNLEREKNELRSEITKLKMNSMGTQVLAHQSFSP